MVITTATLLWRPLWLDLDRDACCASNLPNGALDIVNLTRAKGATQSSAIASLNAAAPGRTA
jgi:hypothetical protein